VSWNLVTLLGAKGFQTPMWDFNVQMLTLSNTPASEGYSLAGLDASIPTDVDEKAAALRYSEAMRVSQQEQFMNPDCRVILAAGASGELLERYATALAGIIPATTQDLGGCLLS